MRARVFFVLFYFQVEALVAATLEAFAAAGPDPDAVEASLNSIEFSLREFNTGSFPRGLSFMLGALNQWIYDRDPYSGLRFEVSAPPPPPNGQKIPPQSR